MKKVRVIQLIHGFPTGGAESLVKQYCLLFNKDKIELLVVALHNYHSIFDQELLERGIRVMYIDDIIDKRFSVFPAVFQKVMHRVYRKSLVKRMIRDFSPNVIHYHLMLSDYIKYANPHTGIKIYLTIHSDPQKLWGKKKNAKKDRRAIEWLIKNKTFRFIALHEVMRKEINEMFGVRDAIVIKNGIITERFTTTMSKTNQKKELEIPESSTVIGHIGSFVKVKNHRFLVEVFDNYLKINNDAILVLIGTGKLKKSIEKLVKKNKIEDHVYFLGVRSDIPELLHIMDALIFPSLYEGLPLTLIEAQMAKVPCLVSDRVTKDVKISNLLYFESLNHSADDWAKMLNQIIRNTPKPVVNSKDWDLKNIVSELEQLYIS